MYNKPRKDAQGTACFTMCVCAEERECETDIAKCCFSWKKEKKYNGRVKQKAGKMVGQQGAETKRLLLNI